MILLHTIGGHVTQVSTDDFGNQVMAVTQHHEHPVFNDIEQVLITEGTWWHLFDMDEEIRAERDAILSGGDRH